MGDGFIFGEGNFGSGDQWSEDFYFVWGRLEPFSLGDLMLKVVLMMHVVVEKRRVNTRCFISVAFFAWFFAWCPEILVRLRGDKVPWMAAVRCRCQSSCQSH